jgi:trehalose 6-phosphate phosphatase
LFESNYAETMGRDKLDVLAVRAADSGVFLDFDGTLSEIAAVPAAAKAVPGATEILARLADRFRVVAVVSGRMASEVKRKLGNPPGVRFFGLYGLERPHEAGEQPQESRTVEEILPRVLEVVAGVSGSFAEPKGPNVAVHYRQAPDPEVARQALFEALDPLATAAGMSLIEGKRVLELVPKGAPTKGDLLLSEGEGLGCVLYAGDDLADIEAFAAVDRLAAGGAEGIKVAVRSAETPSALLGAADIVAERPADLVELLATLVR